jgi:hypothetical protein
MIQFRYGAWSWFPVSSMAHREIVESFLGGPTGLAIAYIS